MLMDEIPCFAFYCSFTDSPLPNKMMVISVGRVILWFVGLSRVLFPRNLRSNAT
ncbi:hypothetical protein SLEP1_g52740 [Rubroshorea leprosula]|uniref:Uncharacterized protein n=1 Tax=Rubroshorea leprosula TaxID=152421 RepID=A0AAV5MAM8_9ROSI|nr:hypothetical protein SLEP1_g52740 [Rubroshorea leprosula]